MTRTTFLAVCLTVAALSPAAAQSSGIAFAQAPEAGLGVCFSDDMASASSCAQAQCMEESGLAADDCAVTKWCLPAGWSTDVFMQHQEGVHWHEFLCGWSDQAQLEAAVAVKCASEWLIECVMVRTWDFDGNEVALSNE